MVYGVESSGKIDGDENAQDLPPSNSSRAPSQLNEVSCLLSGDGRRMARHVVPTLPSTDTRVPC